MSRDTLVSFEGVVKTFGAFVAVKKLDFEIKKGEFLAIMGSSGCGKTTTLRMLAGLEAPSEGVIRLSGKPINDLPTWSRDTPMVWQSLALFPFLNVRENVEFALKMRGVGKAERRKRAEQWLDNHPEASPALQQQIKQQFRDAFYTDTPQWKQQVVAQGLQAAQQAVAALAS